MPTETILYACRKLSPPVLSVYVNTTDQDATRHPRVRPELTWFRETAAVVRRDLSYRDHKLFDRQVRRVRRFLEQRCAAEGAMVIFSGVKCWKVIPVRVPLHNVLHWGKPSISPLLPMLYAHRRYGIVVMDRLAVRYFAYTQGDLILLGGKKFEIDVSQWKRKDQGRVGAERTKKSRGPQRDLYERRIEAQYKRLCHQSAGEIEALAKKHEFQGLILVGPDRLIKGVQEKIPHPLHSSALVIRENLGRTSPRELQRHLQPLIDHYEQEQQMSAVKLLQASNRTAVTNPDEVLAQFQNGRIRALLVAQDLELLVRQCPKCGFASRGADPACAAPYGRNSH
jgi:Bacterial archaeo-eukaryotic release factor family 10